MKVSIGQVCEIVPGRHILGELHNSEHKGIPYITGPADFTDFKALPSRWTTSPDVMCQPDDLLITVKGAGVGKLNFAPDEPACIGRQIMAIRVKPDEVNRGFLFHSLQGQFTTISEKAIGATVPGLSIEHVESIEIRLPSLEVQRGISDRLTTQIALVKGSRQSASDSLAAIGPLFEKILAETFRGITPLALNTQQDAPPPGWTSHPLPAAYLREGFGTLGH